MEENLTSLSTRLGALEEHTSTTLVSFGYRLSTAETSLKQLVLNATSLARRLDKVEEANLKHMPCHGNQTFLFDYCTSFTTSSDLGEDVVGPKISLPLVCVMRYYFIAR